MGEIITLLLLVYEGLEAEEHDKAVLRRMEIRLYGAECSFGSRQY